MAAEKSIDDYISMEDEFETSTIETVDDFSDSEKKPSKRKTAAKKPVKKAETEEGDKILSNEEPHWYVVHCYSGYENKVCHNLEQRKETIDALVGRLLDVVVPTQEEVEVRDGKRKTLKRNIFPGYVLVKMIMTEEAWFYVRNTPGVTGFLSAEKQPLPLRPEEEAAIFKRMEADAPHVNVTFQEGERVRIVDGPFNDFRGVVSSIDMEKSKVRVMVNFFGRETPVELDFLQVERS